MLWTYADAVRTARFARVGGGTYDAATNTWGQGAFNADDMARAAVVYLRRLEADRLARTAATRRSRCCAA